MKKSISLSISFCLLGVHLLFAQVGLDFLETSIKLKGAPLVAEEQTYQKAEMADDGSWQPVDKAAMWSVSALEDGLPVQLDHYIWMGDEAQHMTRTEIDRSEGVINQVRHYSMRWESKPSLNRRHQLFYAGGKIQTENILDESDKNLATLQYAYSTSPQGNEVLTMTQYKPNSPDPQGHYYLEWDEWGKVLHIESVGPDTGLYVHRNEMIGDSIFNYLNIRTSRRARGTKDTFNVRHHIRRDEYGNPVDNLILMDGKDGGKPFNYQSLRRITYTYPGDDPMAAVEAPTLTAEQLSSKWISNSENIELSLGGFQGTGGIYSTDTMLEDTSEIMDTASDWIYQLQKSGVGEWYWDAAEQTITFKQRDHLVVKVKVVLDRYNLTLTPVDKPYANDLVLRKQK